MLMMPMDLTRGEVRHGGLLGYNDIWVDAGGNNFFFFFFFLKWFLNSF
jgi:hypothetical protein